MVGHEQAIALGNQVIGRVICLGGHVMSDVCPEPRGARAFEHLIVAASPYILDL